MPQEVCIQISLISTRVNVKCRLLAPDLEPTGLVKGDGQSMSRLSASSSSAAGYHVSSTRSLPLSHYAIGFIIKFHLQALSVFSTVWFSLLFWLTCMLFITYCAAHVDYLEVLNKTCKQMSCLVTQDLQLATICCPQDLSLSLSF